MNETIDLPSAMLLSMPDRVIFWTWKQTVYVDVVVQNRAGPISWTPRDCDGRGEVHNAEWGIPGRSSG